MPAEQVFGGKEAMDWLTFVVEITRAAAWPLVATGFLTCYRRVLWAAGLALVGLLRRIKSATLGSFQLQTMDADVDRLTRQALTKQLDAATAESSLERDRLVAEVASLWERVGELQGRRATYAGAPTPPPAPTSPVHVAAAMKGDSIPLSFQSPSLLMRVLINELGRDQVLQGESNRAEIQKRVSNVLGLVAGAIAAPSILNRQGLEVLIRSGVVGSDFVLTAQGFKQLLLIAEKMKSEQPLSAPEKYI